MSYNIIYTPDFEKQFRKLSKKYKSLINDFELLIDELKMNPGLGISLGNNCYKIRLAIKSKGKGKSGGARVITYVVVIKKEIYLITIYDKSEQSSISDADLKRLANKTKK